MDVDNMAALIDALRLGMEPRQLHEGEGVQYVLVPGIQPTIQRIEHWKDAPTPRRKSGTINVFDIASFNMLLRDHGAEAAGATVHVDRDVDKPSVVAVLNPHSKHGAGWGDFRVRLLFQPTPQWAKWRGLDGKMLVQEAFAEFIEENAVDVVTPPKAELLEIAQSLDIRRTVNFRSAIRLSSGAIRFAHEQDDVAKVGAGEVAVPDEFVLGLAPFTGLASYRVPARFRYRLTNGKLTLGFKLQRVEDLIGQIVKEVVEKIERGASLTVLEGPAPAAVER